MCAAYCVEVSIPKPFNYSSTCQTLHSSDRFEIELVAESALILYSFTKRNAARIVIIIKPLIADDASATAATVKKI